MTSATATPFPETIVALRSGLLKLFRDWWRGERLIGKLAPPPPKVCIIWRDGRIAGDYEPRFLIRLFFFLFLYQLFAKKNLE